MALDPQTLPLPPGTNTVVERARLKTREARGNVARCYAALRGQPPTSHSRGFDDLLLRMEGVEDTCIIGGAITVAQSLHPLDHEFQVRPRR